MFIDFVQILMNIKNSVNYNKCFKWYNKYIEIFNSSTISISYFRDRGYSWNEIEGIFKQAISNQREIQLDHYNKLSGNIK